MKLFKNSDSCTTSFVIDDEILLGIERATPTFICRKISEIYVGSKEGQEIITKLLSDNLMIGLIKEEVIRRVSSDLADKIGKELIKKIDKIDGVTYKNI